MKTMRQRKRNRLEGYDYSLDALYFVTICVKDRSCYFGQVVEGQVRLNEAGEIAHKQWLWLAERYPYVLLHEFTVMPNHIHGIVEINRQFAADAPKIKSLDQLIGAYKTTSAKQIHLLSRIDIDIPCRDRSRPVPTTMITKQTSLLDPTAFAWQRSFYDRIIRNEQAYRTISNYILTNPERWEEDRFYQQH